MLRRKEPLLIGILLLLGLPYGYDFSHEIFENEHDWTYLLVESLSVTLASLGIFFLLGEIRRQQRAANELQAQLGRTRTDLLTAHANLKQLNQKVQQASRQYGLVIQEQLAAWELSPSEKEVALLLLKGLSFEEIAQARGTSEKTVRQQATAIYRKSGLSGRYELAAWFFEDFLQERSIQPPDTQAARMPEA